MNPFRKKSLADKEVRVEETVTQQLAGVARVSVSPAALSTNTVEVGVALDEGGGAGVPLDLWSDIAPVAVASPTSQPRANIVDGGVTDGIMDIRSDTAPVFNPATSPTSPPRVSPASPPPPSASKASPRSPPPPVAPRRPRSQIVQRKISTPERTTTPDPSVDPFNPNPDASSESDAEPPAINFPQRQVPRSMSPANPFLRAKDGGVRRSLDMSELSITTTPAVQKPGRQSLDVDAFKRLMLTGQSTPTLIPPPQLDSSSTDTSSVSRQSIFEPILETETSEAGAPDTETPRTSHEIDDDDGRSGRVRSVSGGRVRPKPPPPKPRSRGAPGGGKSPIASTIALAIPTSPPPPPPGRVIRTLTQAVPTVSETPPSPTLLSPIVTSPPYQSPSPTSPPASPATSLRKRVPPSPPISRRQSIQKPNPRSSGELERPSTPNGGGKMKPPPPPVRRMKSVNNRPHERSLSVTTMPPPPPPPPGTVRSRSSTMGSVATTGENLASPVASPTPTSSSTWPIMVSLEKQGDVVVHEGDILVDLQKLQREVDELRGKYEGRKLDIEIAAGE